MESAVSHSEPIPRCAAHPELAAATVCARCGDNVCSGCKGRDGICPACKEKEPRRVAWWQSSLALVFGGICAQIFGALPVVVAVVLYFVENPPLAGVEPDLEPVIQELITSFWVLGPSIVLTGGTMAAVALATPLLAKVPLKEALGLKGAPWPAFIAAPIGILALGPTSDALRRFMVEYLPWFTLGTLEGLDEIARAAPLWVVIPAMAFVPGFSEEVLFRGLFQRSIRNGALAVILSGLFFALYHMDPHHVAAVLPLGFYLAWLKQRTGSLFVPVTGHVFNNAAAVLASVYFAGEVDEPLDWWFMPIGWVVCGLCVFAVVWSTRKKEA